jgi:hypothetical protein
VDVIVLQLRRIQPEQSSISWLAPLHDAADRAVLSEL